MNVLVTGGAGLIGMATRHALAARGHSVVAIDITTFDRDDPDLILMPPDETAALDELVEAHGIDAIIHCAAISGPMLAKGQPLLMVDVNVVATARLLDLARRHRMRRFCFTSSISVYGSVGRGLITETTPLHPTSIYGASKIACEALVEGFAAEYGVDGVSLRISRVYGPYRRANCYLGDIIRDAAARRETEIPCEPDFAYHYVYVDDVAEALLAVLERPNLPHRAYNLNAAMSHTMPQIAEIAAKAVPGARIALVPGADPVSDVQEAFDVSLIATDTGWRPRFDIAAGLAAYREAILSRHAAI